MKFGKHIENTAIPEWKFYYMNYRLLKQSINQIAAKQAAPTTFFEKLQREQVPSISYIPVFSHNANFMLLPQDKIVRFFTQKEQWCRDVEKRLQEQVNELQEKSEGAKGTSVLASKHIPGDHSIEEMYITRYLNTNKCLNGFSREIALLLNVRAICFLLSGTGIW